MTQEMRKLMESASELDIGNEHTEVEEIAESPRADWGDWSDAGEKYTPSCDECGKTWPAHADDCSQKKGKVDEASNAEWKTALESILRDGHEMFGLEDPCWEWVSSELHKLVDYSSS